MSFDYSDGEINQMLIEAEETGTDIDPRVGKFWSPDLNNKFAPLGKSTDKIYNRYTVSMEGPGMTTEDFFVNDILNSDFDVSMSRFLEMDETGDLPTPVKEKKSIFYSILSRFARRRA